MFVRGRVNPKAIVRLEGLGNLKKKKKSNDLIGDRTCDPSACSIRKFAGSIEVITSKIIQV
jgi:hypothetical protein